MTNEELVQRFIDQELSAGERMQFVVALGRDQTLRDHVLALEQLVIDAAKLPRPAVPTGFAARILERTSPPKPTEVSPWRRAIEALWAPRVFQWNLAGAAAIACVVLVAVGAVVATTANRAAPTVAQSTEAGPARLASGSPEPAPPGAVVLVRLVVVQPGARVVQAAGDFNGWNPSRTPLEQTADGAWTVTLPLEPGRYEYQFVVDGDRWIGDPFAVEQSNDGFGSRNAVLDVRPAEKSL